MIYDPQTILMLVAQTLILGGFFMRIENRITRCETEIKNIEKRMEKR